LAADIDRTTELSPVEEDLPEVQDPPATIASENSLQAWQELFMTRRTWALDVAEIVRNGVDTLQKYSDETEVIARSTTVALDNLKSHVGTLQNKFQKTQSWAYDMLEEHKSALSDWQASTNVLKELPARKDIIKVLQPSTDSSADSTTLHELVDIDRILKAESDLSGASDIFRSKLQELTKSVEALLQSTSKAQQHGESGPTNYGDSTGLLEESETLAKRISTDYEEVLRFQDNAKSISLASRRALVHTQELLPTLQTIANETRQAVSSAYEERKSHLEKCLRTLRDISMIESGLGELQSQITALDVEPRGSDGLEAMNRIFQLPVAYGSTLIEAIRRSEWSNQVRSDIDTLHEDMSQQKDDEQRRRKKWVKAMSDFLQDVTDVEDQAIKVEILIPDTNWPAAVRDEIFAYIDDLGALGIDDAVRQVTQMLRELDTAVKPRKRIPTAFKNGSVHEMEQSFVSTAHGGNARSLQDEKLRLEDKLRASDSRVRKLEDLLHRSSQMNRPPSGTFGTTPDTERYTSSPTNLTATRPNDVLLSRRSSVSSRRLSNQTEEEKVLVKRIVSLEAEVMRLQREAHAERRTSIESRDKMQEAESVKRDLMANFESQRQEFDDERQILEDETHKLKIRLEEAEDELDRVIGSRDHVRLASEETISTLQAEVDRLRQASETSRQDAIRQRERATSLEKQIQQLREEKSAMQHHSVDLANQLRDLERERQDHVGTLQDVHSMLSPGGSAPDQLAKLVTAIEILSEGLSIHARGLDEKLQLAMAENKGLEEKVHHAESQLRKLEKETEDHEATSASLGDALSRESGKLASVRAELNDERDELKSLRSKFAAGETGSEALRERLIEEENKAAEFSERLATADANSRNNKQELDGLKQRLQSLTNAEQKWKSRLEARGSRAKDLSERLFQHNDRMIRMLEQLGYSVTRQDDRLVIQRASKVNASTILSGVEASTMMKRTISGSSPPQHYQETSDLDTLYWVTDSDGASEAAKYRSFTSALARLDLDAAIDLITKRYKDVETMAKKYQKESRAYREKSHRLQSEAHDKIAYRSFKDGDLALFLPTRNQATRPWAAFNVGAPHYFLREQDAHMLPNRDWLLARISKVEERVVDLSRSLQSSRAQAGDRQSINTDISDGASTRSFVDDENPFELSDGLRWYMIDASEEKPGAPTTPGLGKSTVAASNVEVKGSIRLTKEGKRLKESPVGNTATKTLSKSLDSRRSSSGSKKEHGRSPSITNVQTLARMREGEAVRPADADLQSSEAREDASVFDVVRKDLLLGP
jgi:autophagy-related protein 11